MKLYQEQYAELEKNMKDGSASKKEVRAVENCKTKWFLEELGKQVGNGSIDERRPNLTSDLKSVTSITYISMCILLIRYGPL